MKISWDFAIQLSRYGQKAQKKSYFQHFFKILTNSLASITFVDVYEVLK